MAIAVAAWILLSTVGLLLLVVIPEQGPRVFSISDDHGPSAIDLAGVLALLVGWTIPAAVIWRGRRTLWQSGVGARLGAAVALLSSILLVLSVLGDLGYIWIAAAILLALLQILAFRTLVRSSTRSREASGSTR